VSAIGQRPSVLPSITFGLEERLPRAAAEHLRVVLVSLWEACHHQPPAGVRPDLELHRRFFDPVAQGKRLRQALLSIDPLDLPGALSDAQALPVDGQRWLITPEGRIAIELLGRALDVAGDDSQIDQAIAARRERDLLDLYRDWSRHRLRSVVDLLGGGDKPLQVPAIGAVLTLLINRCDGPERAMKRFGPGTARDVIDDVFRSCAHEFAQQLAPSQRRSSEKERLISGWTLGEITRRMPDALHSSDEHGVYIVADRRQELIGLLVEELRRRPGINEQLLDEAFDALVREFGRRAQALAGYGLLYERPAETARLKRSLLEAWAARGPVK
jgi:hypothetical protein